MRAGTGSVPGSGGGWVPAVVGSRYGAPGGLQGIGAVGSGKGWGGKGWGAAPWWQPTAGGGLAKQYPPGQVGIPYAWFPGYGMVQ